MSNQYYTYDEIINKVDMRELVNYMSHSIHQLDKTSTYIPAKSIIHVENPKSMLISMPAVNHKIGLYINKTATFFERDVGNTTPSIHALVTAFSSTTGKTLGILDGAAVTNIKCAAITAIITDYCAIKNSKNLAIIGAGVQAIQQVIGVSLVREIENINIFNRNQSRLDLFIHNIKQNFPNINIKATNSITECVKDADIIATTTSSSAPIHDFTDIARHVHINCMGSHTANSREIPHNILSNSTLIVEDIVTAINEAGALHKNAYDMFMLQQVNKYEIQQKQTIFSSTGYALLDLITCKYIIDKLQK
ncbi:MAG: hypothetical protein PHC75_04300 [Burkholderiales bacterium]|nr:hypothetical protein [Burkholderiales bacterium]